MGVSDIKSITPREFRERGYLQEVNRRFLHPLGLAMSVEICLHDGRDGSEPHEPSACPLPDGAWVAMWDYRDDPEGVLFDETFTATDIERARRIAEEQHAKIDARRALGCDDIGVQPLA